MATHNALIRTKVEEIIHLINGYNSTWTSVFRNILNELKDDADVSELSLEILKLYKGGMGSFSDSVLQRDGKMPIEDNDKLDVLRKELYRICQKVS